MTKFRPRIKPEPLRRVFMMIVRRLRRTQHQPRPKGSSIKEILQVYPDYLIRDLGLSVRDLTSDRPSD